MQADEHNYQPDEQFTNKGWSEMLKTLDKEMPVQEKKRRGFFWFFPLLLIGGVVGFWIFYSSNQGLEMAQSEQVIFNQNQDSETLTESNIEIAKQNTPAKNKSVEATIYKSIENNKPKIDSDFPSIIDSSNPLLPSEVEEIVPVEKNEIIEKKDPLALLESKVVPIDPNFVMLELEESQGRKELKMEEKQFFFEEDIIENPASTNRGIEFGIFAGVVGDFANIKKSGLTTGLSVHFPIGKKLGLKTGLGYSQLPKELPFYFVGNQDANLSSEFFDINTTALPFSTVAVRSSSDFILEKFHQLDLPILLTYSPVKKMEFQLGANATYLIKDQTRLINNNLSINESANVDYSNYGIELAALDLNSISQNQYTDENYWTKLNVSAVAGLAWKPTRRITLELQYHHGLLPILKSNSNSGADLMGATNVQSYEVYNTTGAFDPLSQTPNSNIELSGKQLFDNERFMKNNYSLRFSIGYNF